MYNLCSQHLHVLTLSAYFSALPLTSWKFLIAFEQGARCFHLSMGPTIYVTSPVEGFESRGQSEEEAPRTLSLRNTNETGIWTGFIYSALLCFGCHAKYYKYIYVGIHTYMNLSYTSVYMHTQKISPVHKHWLASSPPIIYLIYSPISSIENKGFWEFNFLSFFLLTLMRTNES